MISSNNGTITPAIFFVRFFWLRFCRYASTAEASYAAAVPPYWTVPALFVPHDLPDQVLVFAALPEAPNCEEADPFPPSWS